MFGSGILLAAGAAAPLLGVLIGLLSGHWRSGLAVQAAGLAVLGVGACALLFGGGTVGAGFHSTIRPAFGADRLTAFFLLLIALVGVPACLDARGSLAGHAAPRALAALNGLFCLALCGLVLARDVSTFLAFWELMTLLPAASILVYRSDREARESVLQYVAITHLGGVGVWVAMLELAHRHALGGAAVTGAAQVLILVAAIVGFGTKAGLMPFHTWLPRTHPIAPPHLSALMSGVMVKLALYGLIRVLFTWAAPCPIWAGVVLTALAGLTALGGIVYALFQHDLKRLLAFCTVENVGIVVLGLGAAALLEAGGHPRWAAFAFAAALLQALNHAVYKALLFMSAGTIVHDAGAELDRLGGLLRRLPWTAGTFTVGCLAVAGLPPLNGFASEWLTLQALLHLAAAGGGLAPSIVGALALLALAAAAGLAALCFVKVVGLVALGAPRSEAAAQAHEQPPGTRLHLVALAALCGGLGVVPGLLIPTFARILPGSPTLALHAGVLAPGTGSLPAPALWIALALVVTALLLLARSRRAAPTPAWSCGQEVVPALAWTGDGFSKPVRLMFEPLLRPTRTVLVTVRRGVLQSVAYDGRLPHLFDSLVYEPVTAVVLRGAAVVRRLQSGSLRAYLVYLLATMLLLLLLVRTGAL